MHQNFFKKNFHIFLIENNSYENFYYKNGTICFLTIYDVLTMFCEVILLFGYSEVLILILEIVFSLKVDFGRFWDCEVRLKMKVPVCISYHRYQHNLLLKGNEIFESKVQRIFPDFSYSYTTVCTSILDIRREE